MPEPKGEERKLRRAPGFALYACGISSWMALVACVGATYVVPLVPSGVSPSGYSYAIQLAYVAVYFLVALGVWRGSAHSPRWWMYSIAGAFGAALCCFAFMAISPVADWLPLLYGMLMGAGMGLGYMRWLDLVAWRPLSEIKELLLIASAASIVASAVFCLLSVDVRVLLFAVVLAPVSLGLMVANERVRSVQAEESAGVAESNEALGMSTHPPRGLGRKLLVPTVCAVVLVLVAPLVSGVSYGNDDVLFRVLLAQGANAVGLLVLAVLLFGLKREVSIFGAYCVFLPVLASALLVSSFVDVGQRWFVLFLGDMCFCVVSFLMLLTSCRLAKDQHVSALFVYGVLGGFVYLARLPEVLVLEPLVRSLPSLTPFALAALILYILTIPAFLLLLLRKPVERKGDGATAPAATSADLTQACEAIAQRCHLPERQAEVLALLACGHSASFIAETLFLSENTVKTYRKAIYAALSVHSKQELINLVRAEAAAEVTADWD